MTDGFGEKTGKLAQIGVRQIPFAALVIDTVSVFLPPSADKRLRDAIQEDLEGSLARLQQRIEQLGAELKRQGKQLDELGAVRTTNVARDFATAATEARSPEKVTALINAAARQFDPTQGNAAARAHWFAILAQLSDIEVQLVSLASVHVSLAFDGRCFHVNLDHKTAHLIDGIGLDETIALENTAQSATAATPLNQLIGQRMEALTQSGGKKWQTLTFGLTPAGLCVARLIAT